MNDTDKRLISETRIDDRAVLQRVMNGGDVPYSLILIDGKEYLSAPTDGKEINEKGMLEYYYNAKKSGIFDSV